MYVDGITVCRNWGGKYENVAILAVIAVNEDGPVKGLRSAEGRASWISWLRSSSLSGIQHIIGDECLGMLLEAVLEVFPYVKYQRGIVHFYLNVFSVIPKGKVKLVARMCIWQSTHKRARKLHERRPK